MSFLDDLREQNFIERLRHKDPSLWSDDPAVQRTISGRLGWLTVHRSIQASMDQLEEVSAWVEELGFRHAVLLGMGGSSLAPEVFARTFGSASGHPELIVLDTTDPTTIIRVENQIEIESTLFIVSSKSGTTLETLSLMRYFEERTRDAVGETGSLDNFIAITDPDTPLHEYARDSGYHKIFLNPRDIGGRYSALSFFGLVPAAIIGVDVARLLRETDTLDWEEAVELGARLADLAQEGRNKITFLPGRGLESLGLWLEQLIAESTGKQGRGIVPIDGEPAGSPSVYADDRVFVYLDSGERYEEIDSTIQAVEAGGHPILTASIDDIHQLGREFLRWEIATVVPAVALGIDPFDEPNVEESKDNTRAVLEQYIASGKLPSPEPNVREDSAWLYANDLTGSRLEAAADRTVAGLVAAHFQYAEPPEYAALLAYIPPNEEHDRLLTRLREVIRDATRLATMSGYGPRYLHSTGQLHKGGPQVGVFLLITNEDPVDEDIPGGPGYSFGVLKQAQALGDLQALQARRRPVIRVHLRGDTTAALRRLVDTVESSASTRSTVA